MINPNILNGAKIVSIAVSTKYEDCTDSLVELQLPNGQFINADVKVFHADYEKMLLEEQHAGYIA